MLHPVFHPMAEASTFNQKNKITFQTSGSKRSRPQRTGKWWFTPIPKQKTQHIPLKSKKTHTIQHIPLKNKQNTGIPTRQLPTRPVIAPLGTLPRPRRSTPWKPLPPQRPTPCLRTDRRGRGGWFLGWEELEGKEKQTAHMEIGHCLVKQATCCWFLLFPMI